MAYLELKAEAEPADRQSAGSHQARRRREEGEAVLAEAEGGSRRSGIDGADRPGRGELKSRLADLQRRCQEAGVPVLIQVDGWECSGKGYVITHLVRKLDPRGYTVHVFDHVDEDERLHVPTWRYWQAVPAEGDVALFDRSVYTGLMNTLDLDEEAEQAWLDALAATEKTLTDNGMVVVKLFLHIDADEQERRIEEYAGDAREVLITKFDRWQHSNYEALHARIDGVLQRTSFDFAPWRVIEACDRKAASTAALAVTCEAIETALRVRDSSTRAPAEPAYGTPPAILESLDMDNVLSDKEYDDAVLALQHEAGELAYRLADHGIPTVMVFEGMDASGKGGAIRRLVKRLDPRLYRINPTSAPEGMAKDHHYLWRFYNNLPLPGRMAIFDRSWYGRVLVERVEGFTPVAEWDRAYAEINAMEKELTDDGAVLLKFFLHIDAEEQLARFEARERDKPWKLTEEDWRNREKRDEYVAAINEMLGRTAPDNAPWTVVAGNDKQFARVEVLTTFTTRAREAIDRADRRSG